MGYSRTSRRCAIAITLTVLALATPVAAQSRPGSIVKQGDTSYTPSHAPAAAPEGALLQAPSAPTALGVVRRLDALDRASEQPSPYPAAVPEQGPIVCIAGCNGRAGEIIAKRSRDPAG